MSPYLAGLRAVVGSRLLLMPAVTGLVFDERGRLLVALHADTGLWAPPGGAVDPDERPVDALVRELREEVGAEVEVLGIVGVYGGPEFRTVYPNGHEMAYVNAAYGCRVLSEVTPDRVEIDQVRWVTEEEAAGLDMPAWSPHVLPEAFAWWAARNGRISR
ncbi:NUDIX domain-containing protein [Thermoactinospora rubra]|uniref:NUDIX domain-containing protein n=1 Tax=Thermoactinospora rubra TaxID=1088767 RepID=UPI00117CAD95|nr:NUDIX domain-containing protein [Thermoactinospora rubra]